MKRNRKCTMDTSTYNANHTVNNISYRFGKTESSPSILCSSFIVAMLRLTLVLEYQVNLLIFANPGTL